MSKSQSSVLLLPINFPKKSLSMIRSNTFASLKDLHGECYITNETVKCVFYKRDAHFLYPVIRKVDGKLCLKASMNWLHSSSGTIF